MLLPIQRPLFVVIRVLCWWPEGVASSQSSDPLASRHTATPPTPTALPTFALGTAVTNGSVSFPQGVLEQGNARLSEIHRLALGSWQGSRRVSVCHLQWDSCSVVPERAYQRGKHYRSAPSDSNSDSPALAGSPLPSTPSS